MYWRNLNGMMGFLGKDGLQNNFLKHPLYITSDREEYGELEGLSKKEQNQAVRKLTSFLWCRTWRAVKMPPACAVPCKPSVSESSAVGSFALPCPHEA